MFEPEDADEMAHAVRQLLDSPTQLSALRAAALQNAERFSWSLIVDDYERLGQKVAL
jgi:glycosyltransferase involved in cell wall biosynthesis